jgi:predicted HTH domain antitoxin
MPRQARLDASGILQHVIVKEQLQMGSRRQQVTEVRAKIARKLVNELRISIREVAYHLGVSSSAISEMLQRRSFQTSGNRQIEVIQFS